MFITNLAILINTKLGAEFYKLYYISVPVCFYCAFTLIFYLKRLFGSERETSELYIVKHTIPTVAALIMNIVYFVIEIFVEDPDNPFLFYILTTVIQLVNVLFIFSYQKKLIGKYMPIDKQALSNVLTYVFVILAVLSLYACVFLNIYIAIIMLLITSFVITLSLSMSLVAKRNYIIYNELYSDDD